MRRLENLKEPLVLVVSSNGGGVAGGDNGDVGLACVGSGERVGTQAVEVITGLDGGLEGIRRESALPFAVLVASNGRFASSGCGWLFFVLGRSGGVGGRSPVSSSEQDAFDFSMIMMMKAGIQNHHRLFEDVI